MNKVSLLIDRVRFSRCDPHHHCWLIELDSADVIHTITVDW